MSKKNKKQENFKSQSGKNTIDEKQYDVKPQNELDSYNEAQKNS